MNVLSRHARVMACCSRLGRATRRWRAPPNGSRKNRARLAHQTLSVAAVNRDVGAMDESGAGGGEEEDEVGDFFGASDAAERSHAAEGLVSRGVGGGWVQAGTHFQQAFGENSAGIDP